jgi:Predicted transcriptional regulators
MTIGELAARSGVSASALRFYERQGLIESQRTDGNQRRYHGTVLRKVALVRAGSAAGIPLERIRDALETLPPGGRRRSATGSGSRAAGRGSSTSGSRRWRRSAAGSTPVSGAAACR